MNEPDVEVAQLGADWWALAGSLASIGQGLDAARRAGVVFASTSPKPIGGGRVMVTVRIIAQPTIRPAVRSGSGGRRRAVLGGAGIGAAVTLACVAFGWAVLAVAGWVAAHAGEIWRTALGGGAIILGAWWVLGKLGACPGVHCPGCRHS